MVTDNNHFRGRLLSEHSIEVLRLRDLAQRLKDAQDAETYGPLAVPTGTEEKPPDYRPPNLMAPFGRGTGRVEGERELVGPEGKRTPAPPTTIERLAGRLSREGTPGRAIGKALTTPVTAESLQQPGIGNVLMGFPVGAPAGSLAGTAGRGVLTQTGRVATQAAQKAAPAVRRLATEEMGAVGKRLIATDHSVRDLPQQAIIEGDRIRIVSRVGRQKAGEYTIARSEWDNAISRGETVNPAYNKRQLIGKYTSELDAQLGGPEQAERIRDSQIRAIEKALGQEPLKTPVPTRIPPTKPAATEALGPAAKPAQATEGVFVPKYPSPKIASVPEYDAQLKDIRAQMDALDKNTGADYARWQAMPPSPEKEALEASLREDYVTHHELFRNSEGISALRRNALSLEQLHAEEARISKAGGQAIPKAPVGARRTPKPVSESVAPANEPVRASTGAAAPPVKPPVAPKIRRITQPEPGFSVIGVDSQGRKVRAVAPTLKEAQAIRANILAGREPFAGAEVQFQQKAVANAERRMKAAIKRGDKGAEQRADVELHELYSTGGKLPPKPPKPPTIDPGGTSVPPPSFEGARDKLVKILQTSVRRSNKELETLRAAERKRRAGMVEAGYQRAAAVGEPPIARIRAAQRGEFPTPELELADRLLPEEVSVLRGSIYDTLGPELRQTAANVDEALTRLATEGKLPTPSEVAWMEEIFGPEFVKALLAHRTRGAKALEIALGVWNLPRALLASFDDSMVLRQGLNLLPEGAPAGRALKAHVKAITEAGAEEIIAGIRTNPWFNHGRARGLDLSLPGVARGLVGREEVFMGAGVGARIPILGRGIRLSERVAEAYLNKLRMETYAAHAQELTRIGASEAAFKELAQNIGILSGRASLGKAQAIAPVLNGLFFSARLNWARAQAPVRILRQVPNLGTPEGRHLAKMLAKDVYGVWAGIAGMLGVAAAAGAAVELDPRSSDFGKMQIGTIRVDPWAGQQQFAVLMARLVTGEVKTTTTRTVRPQEEMDTLSRFIESKFHPALGQLLTIKRGKTYVGEELTVNEYAKQWLPLFVQDIQEITAGTTPGMAAALGTAAFFGVSVYNIPGVPASVINQLEDAVNQYMAIPADSLELAPGQVNREQFREQNPRIDAALFIAGQVTSLASPAAIEEVAKLIKEHGINADDIRGIAQRKERQEQARLAGKYLEITLVDTLINEWLQQPPVEGPVSHPSRRIRERSAATPTPTPARRTIRERAPVGATP